MLNKIIKFFKKNSNLNISYSQCGEDLIVKYVLDWIKHSKIYFLDIGAFDPVVLNNTYGFYNRGNIGMNIDGNSDSILRFIKYRPKDISLNRFVSAKSEIKTYYEFNYPALNTLDDRLAMEIVSSSKYSITNQISINTTSINDIVFEYLKNFPRIDFFSLDIEGLDYEILKEIDFDIFYPLIICVETVDFSETKLGKKREDIMDLISSKGYTLYADTFINSIFVKTSIFE